MRVIFTPDVRIYLKELSEILYEKDYFGFAEDAYNYVEELIFDIVESIKNTPNKEAPSYFSKYGKDLKYAVFKKNQNTQWYVFFNFEEDIYLVRYIGNNYTCAQYL